MAGVVASRKTSGCGPHGDRHPTLAPEEEAVCRTAAGIFRVLGDPGRLRLLTLLLEHEVCVSEMAELLEEGLSTVSQRLRLLRSERIVVARREGKHVYYRLADRHVKELMDNGLEHAREPFEGRPSGRGRGGRVAARARRRTNR